MTNRIRQLRCERGLTVTQLAALAGVSLASLQYVDRNPKAEPRNANARKIAAALDVPLEALFDSELVLA